jgi:hypothetical protein
MTVSEASPQPKTVSAAILLLGLSAMYSIVVEIWSAPFLFFEARGLSFVIGLVAGVLIFYVFYGWLIYKTWQGVNAARYSLIALIVIVISIHVILALTPAGELFGPVYITAMLDGLRVIAVVLLLVSPRAYWKQSLGD